LAITEFNTGLNISTDNIDTITNIPTPNTTIIMTDETEPIKHTKETWDALVQTDESDVGELEMYALDSGYSDLASMIIDVSRMNAPWLDFNQDEDANYVAEIKSAISGHPIDPDSRKLFGSGKLVVNEAGLVVEGTSMQTPTSSSLDKSTLPPTLSDADTTALEALHSRLVEVNGQDAYNVSSMALGALKRDEFLVLPENLRNVRWSTDNSAVGAPWNQATSPVKFLDFVNIYCLNKEVGKDTKDAVFFALVRAEAVKMGWFESQTEVRYATPPINSIEIFIADGQLIEEALETSRVAAFLIPFFGEFIFRTTGHHYLSGMADEYERKYQAICSACLTPDLTRKLRSSELWHKVMHWVGPAKTRRVMTALSGTPRIPNAIAIRSDSAPAGTALVTTTAAVIEALESCNWASEVIRYGGHDFELIKEATRRIKADVAKYHTAYFAYEVAPPTTEEKAYLMSAISEASKFAPVAQGFIDAMYSDSSLGRAKALRKHADMSPVLMRKALRVFRNLARSDTETIADIYRTTAEDRRVTTTAAQPPTPA